MTDKSQSLKDSISNGESLAEIALRKVFDFGAGFAPETNQYESQQKDEQAAKSASLHGPESQKNSKNATGPKPFKAEDYANDGKRHLLLACSGSVASIKLPNMVKELSSRSKILSIRIVLTSSAAHFLQDQAEEQPSVDSLRAIPGVDGIYHDADEWGPPSWTRGAPILHIELRRWADLLVVAPLSANTMAKMVNGICDNLLTSVIRAWDTEAMMGFAIRKTVEAPASTTSTAPKGTAATPSSSGAATDSKPAAETQIVRRRKLIMVAPAMNTAMWQHPITGKQLKTLEDEWTWVRVLVPTQKALACGDVGIGAMKEWSLIVNDIEEALRLQHLDVRQARTSVVAV